MKRLYYLRHGQSVLNVQGVYAGTLDTPLTKDGEQQALLAGKGAKNLDIDLILCSPRSRAQHTAKLFAEGAGLPDGIIQVNDLLTERDFGILEGTPYSPDVSHNLFNDNLPEGVESWESMVSRSQKLLNYIESLPVDNIVLVAHGANGRAIRSLVEPTADIHAGIPNAELVRWI